MTQAPEDIANVSDEQDQSSNIVPTKISGRKSSRKSATAFRTISEVADELGVQQHVLRFWETKFSQVRPLKRGGGRRYYRPEDVELLSKIHNLLYTEGYTIKGVQKLLKQVGRANLVRPEVANASSVASVEQASASAGTTQSFEGMSEQQKVVLRSVLEELKELRGLVNIATTQEQ